jgi:FtsH-binding integral membrane protein
MVSPMVTGLGALVPLFGLAFTNPRDHSPALRMGLLGTFAGLSGMSVGPMIAMATAINPMLVPTALGATGLVFGGATMAALFTKSGSFLRFGAPMMGCTLAMAACGIGMFFVPATSALYPVLHNVYLYGGLMLGSAFVAYDTQRIIQDYKDGNEDVPMAVANMFINLKMIFTRLLWIFSNQD